MGGSIAGGSTNMGNFPGVSPTMNPSAAQSFMQMQMMQQQNMMALQQMLMQMNMRPQGDMSMMGGMPSQMGYAPQGSMMGGLAPSMMSQNPSAMPGSQMHGNMAMPMNGMHQPQSSMGIGNSQMGSMQGHSQMQNGQYPM
jgi:hypothetical protein